MLNPTVCFGDIFFFSKSACLHPSVPTSPVSAWYRVSNPDSHERDLPNAKPFCRILQFSEHQRRRFERHQVRILWLGREALSSDACVGDRQTLRHYRLRDRMSMALSVAGRHGMVPEFSRLKPSVLMNRLFVKAER